MKEYGGLLAVLSEAHDIKVELGLSDEEAYAEQRRRADERLREYELASAETNVIYGVNFDAKHDPEAA